jgi:nitric oxide synthase oxygenase domain/subunit
MPLEQVDFSPWELISVQRIRTNNTWLSAVGDHGVEFINNGKLKHTIRMRTPADSCRWWCNTLFLQDNGDHAETNRG